MPKKIYYIAYKVDTLEIVEVSDFYNKSIYSLLSKNVNFINITHPKSQDKRKEINLANNTDY